VSSRVESVQVAGGSFDLGVWLPASGTGPGLLLIQEIFGVSDYIQEVADELAGLGYVVGAPDLFWRLEPGYAAGHDEAGLKRSLQMASRFDFQQGVADAAAALARLAALPEVDGSVGVIGFCLGGTIAYFLAAEAEPGALAVVVSFYGSGVPDATDALARVSAPVQFHFGGSDSYIPREKVALVEQAVAGKPNAEIHVEEDAGHAFHNRKGAMFYAPDAAARAWRRTEEFLARHHPAGKAAPVSSAPPPAGEAAPAS
jgi:carboxymethylenebutenolidase